jgi:hypothetical protein
MAGRKTPRELADRMRDHRAQHRARDGFVRETFTQPRDDARQTVREFLDRYPMRTLQRIHIAFGSPSMPVHHTKRSRRKRGRTWRVSLISASRQPARQS